MHNPPLKIALLVSRLEVDANSALKNSFFLPVPANGFCNNATGYGGEIYQLDS